MKSSMGLTIPLASSMNSNLRLYLVTVTSWGEIKIVNGYKLETRILSLRTLDTVSKNFSRPDVLDWYINTVLDKVVNEKVIDINKLIGC